MYLTPTIIDIIDVPPGKIHIDPENHPFFIPTLVGQGRFTAEANPNARSTLGSTPWLGSEPGLWDGLN